MTEAQAIDLLMENKGEVLSATSWEGFCSAGHGCVLTDGQEAHYLPLRLVKRLNKVVRQRLLGLVQSYQPDREVVAALLVHIDTRIFIAMGTRTPALSPEAAFLARSGTEGYPPMRILGIEVPD